MGAVVWRLMQHQRMGLATHISQVHRQPTAVDSLNFTDTHKQVNALNLMTAQEQEWIMFFLCDPNSIYFFSVRS